VSANLDLVRSIYEQWSRGDWTYGWAHDDIEYLGGDGLESNIARGIPAMNESWHRFREAWDEFHPEVEDVRELDDRRVLALIQRSGRGFSSGVELQGKSAHLFEICDGKVVRFVHYWDRNRALADLGLEGGAGGQENVEVVRAMYEAFNRGDVAASREMLHPAAELHQPRSVADAAAYYGRSEFVRGLVRWLSAFEQPRFELLASREMGGKVLLHIRATGTGKTSGVKASAEFFHAWTFADGKPFQCFVRDSEAEAIASGGLEEQ
jgi:ketosteroid isomerase-like protein